ncbi:MAG TPA: ATP-binding protein [Nitrospinota bacterium]|nr:ATP-binding protein [Nitrospinota bacterium]
MDNKPTYEELRQRVRELEKIESERKQVELELKNSQQKDCVWLENSPVCTKIVDLDFNLQYMSVAGIKALKVDDVSQLYGTPYPFNFFPKSTKKSMAEILEKVKKTGEIITAEALVADIDGNEMWFQATFVPIKDNEGRIEYIIVVSVDINERKKIEAELAKFGNQLQEMVEQRTSELQQEVIEHKETERDLEKAKELAEKANQAKSEFLSRMSHEIRTPMNSILGCSELLGKTSLDDMQKDYLKRVSESGKLLLGIIDDILDFSKFGFGKIKLESTPFNLEELIINVFKIIVSKMKDNHFDTYIDIDDAVPEYVGGDPMRLKQILVNLLGNAVKFTTQGEIGVIVSVEKKDNTSPDDCHLRFTVKDTGVGIPKEKQANIFESFTQADDSTTRLYGGTGLGLSICKSLVTAMDGTIWVESEPGKGSEFIFVVKMKKEKDVKEYNIKEEEEQKQGEEESCAGVKMLVAEDVEENQIIIKYYCHDLGCKADYAMDGKEAIEKLKSSQYDLCLMDIHMPVMGGIDATKIIRKEINKNLPIIALTAAVMSDDQEKAMAAGMNDFLRKPIDMDKLREMILRYGKKTST